MKRTIQLTIVIVLTTFTFTSFAQNNSYPFDVKITGKGSKSIIFIPGFACSGDVWNDTRAVYEKNFTCYTLTMAGFAGVPPQKDASFDNWEKGIAQYIKDKKIDKPIIIGHSMGGGWAMAIAADYPDLLSGIVVVDALPCLAFADDSTFKVSSNKDYSSSTSMLSAFNDEAFYAMQKLTMPYLLADTSHLEMVVQWSVKSDRATFGQMYADFMNTDLREKIATVKCPALILLEKSFLESKPAVEKQFSKLKTAQINYSTKGLHFIMYDDTAWYMKQLAAFVK